MMTPHRTIRVRLVVLAFAVLAFAGAACTPEQVTAYVEITAPATQAARANGLSDEGLERLRWCESRGDYSAVSASGTYRGAYQFSRSTWNAVARRHYPWLEGVDPAAAEFYWQDAMARALWSEAGRQPWPTCGRRV